MRIQARTIGIALAVAVAAAGAVPVGSAAGAVAAPAHADGVVRAPLPQPETPSSSRSSNVFAASSWWGGSVMTSTGTAVTVMVADVYAGDPGIAQAWAELFAGLVHGDELAVLRAYVAPIEWVEAICGPRALGCYGGDELITIGAAVDGVTPWEVAAHEYGHHVAANRLNPPWRAVDWGTKRWASQLEICPRAAAGTVFPGDEGWRYHLNPGEGFAEAYRVLNERRRGASVFSWSIVDPSFSPNDAALARIDADVRDPWVAPSRRTVAYDFRNARSWRLPIAAPLDGQLEVSVQMRAGASHDVALLAGTKLLARGQWSSANAQRLSYVVCGERSLTLRVLRRHGSPRLVVGLATP